MLVTALTPDYTSNKSYYGKARVITLNNGVKMLQSYDTVVAIILPKEDGKVVVYLPWMNWSATTGRHVFDFLMQNDVSPHLSDYGFKSFASFMRDVSRYEYDCEKHAMVDFSDSTQVCEYRDLDRAIHNFEEL